MDKANQLMLKSYVEDIKAWTKIAETAIDNSDTDLMEMALETINEKIDMMKYWEAL